ncbi:MAG: hypothetical protein AB1505_19515 [Candidatus Latescibacterota bacterium]
MALPELTETGDLPPGVHPATLPEVLHRFGTGSGRRQSLGRRLQRVHEVALSTGHLARFVVFGSFITSKTAPNDVDVFMIMDDDFDFGQVRGAARLLFQHAPAQDHFGCSVFWVRRLAALGGEQAAIEDWQIKRDGSLRGIVEIVGE